MTNPQHYYSLIRTHKSFCPHWLVWMCVHPPPQAAESTCTQKTQNAESQETLKKHWSVNNPRIGAACPRSEPNRWTSIKTPAPPQSVLLYLIYFDAKSWFASEPRDHVAPSSSSSTRFTLNHFTERILRHCCFCSCCCAGWTGGNCAWQSSLRRYYRAGAWLQLFSLPTLPLVFRIVFPTHTLALSLIFVHLYPDQLLVETHSHSDSMSSWVICSGIA